MTSDAIQKGLRQRRTDLKLTQESVARSIGARPQVVQRLEREGAFNPRLNTLLRVAEALGLVVVVQPKEGTRTLLAGPVAVCAMSPDARDVLDAAMDRWKSHLPELERISGKPPEDPVYSFAYWLLRYSGLVVPVPLEPKGGRA